MTPPPFKFTSYALDTCIEVAKAIDDHGGVASADELAVRLGYKSKNNGAFLTRIANARLFGLIDGTSSELRPSARAIQVLRPDYPATAGRARLEAFESVPLFKEVLDYYHGQMLPDETGMKNALETRWKIDPDRSTFVLARLTESAEQAGLFSVAGNRTKMIRPTFGQQAHTPPAAGNASQQGGAASQGTQQDAHRKDARSNKLVDGALDMLPVPSEGWDEAEFQQWLAFFESALRVVYRLPTPSTTATATSAPARQGAA